MRNEKIYYDPILIKKKQITEKYSYTPRTLPTAPDIPSISPRRKVQILPKSHEIRNVGDKVRELERTTILTSPHDPIRHLRRDVKESDERLLFVKSGHSIDHLNINNNNSITQNELQNSGAPTLREQTLEETSTTHPPVRSNSTVYVYHGKSISTGPASEIQNGLNLMRHNINEMNRKQYNKIIKEVNLRNKRRPSVLNQMNDDIEKYGMEECFARAKRARQYSSLKLKRDESWWEVFIDSIPEDLRTKRTTRFINKFSAINFYNEKNITNFVFEFSKTEELQNHCYSLMKLVNSIANFLDDDRLEFIFYKAEKRRIEKEQSLEET